MIVPFCGQCQNSEQNLISLFHSTTSTLHIESIGNLIKLDSNLVSLHCKFEKAAAEGCSAKYLIKAALDIVLETTTSNYATASRPQASSPLSCPSSHRLVNKCSDNTREQVT